MWRIAEEKDGSFAIIVHDYVIRTGLKSYRRAKRLMRRIIRAHVNRILAGIS